MNAPEQLCDAQLIEQIVREVLGRLTKPGPAAGPPTSIAAATTVNTNALQLDERVVSVATLSGRLAGKSHVVLRRGAVLTPAARDALKEHGLAVGYAAATKPAGRNTLTVGVAETRFEAAGLLRAIESELAGLEHLAHTGLPTVIEELSEAVAKGGRLGLLITEQPELAVCAANRVRGVRATAPTGATVARAVAAVGANLLVLDPAGRSGFELTQTVRTFVRFGPRKCPADWAARLG